jgi:glycogen operon protein
MIPEMASRLTGSADIYAGTGRRTYATVNFVTAHDGFTLNDLVTYEQKHNEANGEGNMDGENNNNSRNWGAEGTTESAYIRRTRERMKRNFLATLIFSEGVRMILGGDEFGRTQHGNNNAYCQDNDISWFDWELSGRDRRLLEFTRYVLAVFHSNPVLRRRSYFTGRPIQPDGAKDVSWIRPDGEEFAEEDWADPGNQIIGMLISGRATDEVDERGRPVFGDTVLLLLNGGSRSRPFMLPRLERAGTWEEVVNTARHDVGTRPVRKPNVNLTAHSVIMLRYDEHMAPARTSV